MDRRTAMAHEQTAQHPLTMTARQRVVIENLQPAIDGGRFAIKRTPGESVTVTADIFADGHDLLAGVLKFRRRPDRGSDLPPSPKAPPRLATARSASDGGPTNSSWSEIPLAPLDNDSWTASFVVDTVGRYEYTVEAWIDRFGSWLKGLIAKADAGQDVASELLEGAELVQGAVGRESLASPDGPTRSAGSRSSRARSKDEKVAATDSSDMRLLEIADQLRSDQPQIARVAVARDPALAAMMAARPDRSAATVHEAALQVVVDPAHARFGAWYEMFPRSCTPDPSRSGTFAEAEARLADIAAMGFDIVYLPPVHPIGRAFRKGRNNSLTPEPGDPGSPWAIGGPEGGHTAIEPGLGTIDDFDRFVATANRLGLQVALDIAFQASPDHPWVREHPEWFRHRPDGSIKYAENPPKKYQDIYPLDFESQDWSGLWEELKQVFLFWASHGVTVFRVDNPHTKSLRFWEWCIAEVKRDYPDAIFLSEAFTRPKVMRYLAKSGFTQSYTYFTWRNTAAELREYLTELTTTEAREYLRPNFFANTPDILHEYLQRGGRPAFEVRLVLAATLAASYGIYSGFELCENVAVRPGSEEYLDSEKYQIKVRDWNAAGNLKELIARVNQIRRDHRALQFNDGLRFHNTDNPALLWYSKSAPQGSPAPRGSSAPQATPAPPAVSAPRLFIVCNTDPHHMQHGWVEVPVADLGIKPGETYEVVDLLDGSRFRWEGAWNYVRLDPAARMAHIFTIVNGES
jgi:starch synthase (maltosyl-transferring)